MSPAPERKRLPLAVKIAVGLAAVAGVGALFMLSVRGARSQPYVVHREHLQRWPVALDPGERPTDALLAMRPPGALSREVFGQIFKRAMESLRSPARAEVPLILQDEYDRAFAGR